MAKTVKKKARGAASTASRKAVKKNCTVNSNSGSKTQAQTRDVKAAAREYLQRGWQLMRLPPNSKEPYKGKGETHAKYFITLDTIDKLKGTRTSRSISAGRVL